MSRNGEYVVFSIILVGTWLTAPPDHVAVIDIT